MLFIPIQNNAEEFNQHTKLIIHSVVDILWFKKRVVAKNCLHNSMRMYWEINELSKGQRFNILVLALKVNPTIQSINNGCNQYYCVFVLNGKHLGISRTGAESKWESRKWESRHEFISHKIKTENFIQSTMLHISTSHFGLR